MVRFIANEIISTIPDIQIREQYFNATDEKGRTPLFFSALISSQACSVTPAVFDVSCAGCVPRKASVIDCFFSQGRQYAKASPFVVDTIVFEKV